MPNIVVGHRAARPGLQRQHRLRSVQGLNLALLLTTEHQGVLRGIQIQPHDIHQFLYELGIIADFERPHQVRLEALGTPDAVDHRRTGTQGRCHAAATPVRGVGRLLPRGPLDDAAGHGLPLRGPPSSPGGILLQTRQDLLNKPSPPQAGHLSADRQRYANLIVAFCFCGQQNDLGAKDQPRWSAAAAGLLLQDHAMGVGQVNWGCNSHSLILLLEYETRKALIR